MKGTTKQKRYAFYNPITFLTVFFYWSAYSDMRWLSFHNSVPIVDRRQFALKCKYQIFHSHRFRRDMFFHTIWVCDLDQLNRNKIVKILIHKLRTCINYFIVVSVARWKTVCILSIHGWFEVIVLCYRPITVKLVSSILYIFGYRLFIDDVRATFEQFSIVCPDLFIAINHITLSYKQYFNNLIRMTCAAQGVIKVQSHSM